MKRQIDVEIVLQQAPVIGIIFGQTSASDHNKQMITLTKDTFWVAGCLCKIDNIYKMITLFMIILSGLYCFKFHINSEPLLKADKLIR
jgi:hypothetical protein